MAIALTESDKQCIESYGLKVVEIKRLIHEINDLVCKELDIITDFIKRFVNAFKAVIDSLRKHMRKHNDFYKYMAEMENDNAFRNVKGRTKIKFHPVKIE